MKIYKDLFIEMNIQNIILVLIMNIDHLVVQKITTIVTEKIVKKKVHHKINQQIMVLLLLMLLPLQQQIELLKINIIHY
jgi:hypothetical protein